MAKAFYTTVLTPSGKFFEGEVTYANLPAYDGQLGVMHQRAPLLVQLGQGDLRLDVRNVGAQHFSISGGFAQMSGDKLTVLTEQAEAVTGRA